MFEAYSIGIRVSLINGVTTGLLGMARLFRSTDRDAKELNLTLERIGKTAAVGAGMIGVGSVGLGFLGKAIDAAKDYGGQISLLNQLGMSQKDVAAGVGAAWKAAFDVPTTRVEENLKTLRELRSAFGSTPYQESEARMILPLVQRVSGALTALTGKEQEGVGFDLVKSAELRTIGALSPEILQRNVELMSRTLIAMGGTITANDFHGALKMGKMAVPKWNDAFTYLYLPTLMQELKTGKGGGAQTAGTIMQSLYQQTHGRMTKASMPLWVQAGLVNQGDVVKNASGQWQVKPGAIKGISTFEANPYAWVQQYLRPGVDKLMRERGISAETAVNAMFSNRNAAFGAYTFLMKATQFDRDRKLIEQSKSSEGAYRSLLKTNPVLAEQGLRSQLHNQLVVFGYSVLPDLLKVLSAILPVMRDFTSWLHEHERVAKVTMGAVATVSGFLLVGGGITAGKAALEGFGLLFKLFKVEGPVVARGLPVIAGAFRAIFTAAGALATGLGWWTVPIVAALAAIGGGIFFVARGWERNKSAWTNIREGLGDYWEWMKRMGLKALGLIHRLENPGEKASPGAKGTAFWLKFFHGIVAGARDEVAPYITKAKMIWGLLVKSWDPTVNRFVSGVTDFLNKMQRLATLAHKIMPWAFSDPGSAAGAPKPRAGRPGSSGADIGQFGRAVGGATVDALVGTVLRGFGVPVVGGVRRPLVPPPKPSEVKQINTTVTLDGRVIARAVSTHQERGLEQANRSAAGAFDARRSLAPVGLGVA